MRSAAFASIGGYGGAIGSERDGFGFGHTGIQQDREHGRKIALHAFAAPWREHVNGLQSGEPSRRARIDQVLLLQHARALPARAGSVLCWGFGLLHWGSVNEGSRVPRISVAFEWIADGEEPGEAEKPLLSLDDDPQPFEARLRLIARATRTYHWFDPALSSARALADELLAES